MKIWLSKDYFIDLKDVDVSKLNGVPRNCAGCMFACNIYETTCPTKTLCGKFSKCKEKTESCSSFRFADMELEMAREKQEMLKEQQKKEVQLSLF